MDLPTCPACGQSVLDEDEENCPFCGASMSGKPSAKPSRPAPAPTAAKAPASKPAATAPKAAAPAGKTAGRATRSASPAKAAPVAKDEDPFAVDTVAADKAIPLSPKPLKGRTHAVTCPMCETTGYTSPKAAGQEVRCANPKCLVPIFTAPEIKKEAPAPEPKRSPASVVILGVSALVGMVIVGFVVWFFLIGGDKPKTKTSDPGQFAAKPAQTKPTAEEKKGDEPPKKTTVAAPPSLQELQRSALDAMAEASRVGETTTTRRPYQVRLIAEAFAVAGDLEGAREQMGRFSVVKPSIPFYRIQPLAAIAWEQLEKGDAQASQASIDEAKGFVQNIPETGREPWDAVTTLATVLVATGRGDEAQSLLRQYDRPDDRVRSRYWTAASVVRERGTYDLDEFHANYPWQEWEHPQAVAVTLGAAAHGKWDQAREWAMSQPGVVERSDCVTAWADAAAEHEDAASKLASLDSAVEQLPPTGKARAYARAAARLAAAGNTAAAQPLVQKAKAAIESETPGQPIVLGDMRQVYNSQTPDTTAARMAAIALAEIARAESLLDQQDAAWDSLQRALAFARSTGPSVPAVQSFREEVEVLGTSGLQSRLQEALNLPSVDRARIAANQYQKKLEALLQSARARMDLEAMLVSEAARWDLREHVWEEISSRASAADVNEKEGWFETAVPSILAAELRSAGAEEQAKAIEAEMAGTRSEAAGEEQLRRQTAELVAAGKVQQAAVALQRSNLSEGERNRWAIRLACRLVRERKLDAALQFVRAFRDPLFQEDALDMIAAQAARTGEARKAWDLVQNAGLKSTEKIAYLHGFVGGVEQVASPETGSAQPAGGQ